ncbi:GPGG-motif small membrane protein [Spirillospora sp. NPDC050679]|nr:GPGG-motif small membrane protein [Actinomadura hibisca]
MATILWLIAVVLVIAGIYVIVARRDLLWGIVLIVVGLLVGPGGVSIFNP